MCETRKSKTWFKWWNTKPHWFFKLIYLFVPKAAPSQSPPPQKNFIQVKKSQIDPLILSLWAQHNNTRSSGYGLCRDTKPLLKHKIAAEYHSCYAGREIYQACFSKYLQITNEWVNEWMSEGANRTPWGQVSSGTLHLSGATRVILPESSWNLTIPTFIVFSVLPHKCHLSLPEPGVFYLGTGSKWGQSVSASDAHVHAYAAQR